MDRQILLNIGKNNFVVASRILSVTTYEAAGVKRFVQASKEHNLVLNATCGRKARSIFVLDTGFVILSCVQSETLASRLKLSYAVRTQDKKNADAEDVNNTEAEKKLFSKNKNKTGKKNG